MLTVKAKELKAMACFSSDDESRPGINSVLAVKDAKGSFLVATDGRLIGVLKLEQPLEGPDALQLNIPTSIIKHFRANDDLIGFEMREKDFTAVHIARRIRYDFDLLKNPYPNWRIVFRKPDGPIKPVALHVNLILLEKFAKAGQILGGRNEVVESHIMGTHEIDPYWIFLSAVKDFIGLVMPLRCYGNDLTPPDWVF